MNLTRFLFVLVFLFALTACQAFLPERQAVVTTSATTESISYAQWLGDFDNHAQVVKSGAAHWRYSIRPTDRPEWLAWTIELRTKPSLQLELAMRVERTADGGLTLTPFRGVGVVAPTAEDFDPKQWSELTGCVLSGRVEAGVLKLSADRARCATLAPAMGEMAGLLPMEIVVSGNTLLVRSYSDQALAAEFSSNAQRVRWFGGWVAINGAGADAKADNRDWHMNRDIRIGNQGGPIPVNFRDGQPSGYSLLLETLVVQRGELPLLKLSVVNREGQVVAYSWSDTDSNRIGINLGWIQVGLNSAVSVMPSQ